MSFVRAKNNLFSQTLGGIRGKIPGMGKRHLIQCILDSGGHVRIAMTEARHGRITAIEIGFSGGICQVWPLAV